MKEFFASVLLMVFFILLTLSIGFVLGSWKCDRQWQDSGMKSKFGLLQGCRIEVKPGVWIPAERYRTID